MEVYLEAEIHLLILGEKKIFLVSIYEQLACFWACVCFVIYLSIYLFISLSR